MLLALAVAEVSLRLLVPQPATMHFQRFVKSLRLYRWYDYAQVMENDPELFWRLAATQKLPDDAWPLRGVISNGQGLREDHDIPLEKPPGTLRLLFVGDSCTFGYGLLHHESFVHRVGAKLRSAFPRRTWNASTRGFPVIRCSRGCVF